MNQPHGFQRIVALLNEAMLDDARWPEVSALVDEVCGAKGNTLIFSEDLPESGVEISFVKCHQRGEDRSDWAHEYFRVYHPIAEHVPRLTKLPDGKIVSRASLFTESELNTSITYNEGFARYDMRDGLTVRLDGPSGARIVWGIGDSVDTDGWSSSRIHVIASLLPHIRQYVRVRSALAEAGALGASVAELLDHVRIGVIQLDRRGQIVDANDSAREILCDNDGLSDEGGELRVAWPEDHARLQVLLAQALPRPGATGTSGSMLVRRKSWLFGFALHVKPAADRGGDYRARRVRALVLVADLTERARIEPAFVESALGFTPTEAAIAVQLAKGRTLRQIAAATGREYSTVRMHLRHVFAKLGCSRQFDVAQAVRALWIPPHIRKSVRN